jgi:hypothetical protein
MMDLFYVLLPLLFFFLCMGLGKFFDKLAE